MNIAEILAQALTERGAQKRLALVLGVDQSTVSQWVNGRSEPTADKWRAIEDHLGLERYALAVAKGNLPAGQDVPDDVAARLSSLESKVEAIERLLDTIAGDGGDDPT